MGRNSKFADRLIAQGYCRISKVKKLAARIDQENWIEVLAEYYSNTFQEMLQLILAEPEKYEDIYRREFSNDVLQVGKMTSVSLPGSTSTITGYIARN